MGGPTRPPCQRRNIDAAHTAVIKRTHTESRCKCGPPRICAELADEYNIRSGRERVTHPMRRAGRCHPRADLLGSDISPLCSTWASNPDVLPEV